jgi:hypothetical protein
VYNYIGYAGYGTFLYCTGVLPYGIRHHVVGEGERDSLFKTEIHKVHIIIIIKFIHNYLVCVLCSHAGNRYMFIIYTVQVIRPTFVKHIYIYNEQIYNNNNCNNKP